MMLEKSQRPRSKLRGITKLNPERLKRGDKLIQRWRILVHEGWIEDLDVDAYYQEFCREAGL